MTAQKVFSGHEGAREVARSSRKAVFKMPMSQRDCATSNRAPPSNHRPNVLRHSSLQKAKGMAFRSEVRSSLHPLKHGNYRRGENTPRHQRSSPMLTKSPQDARSSSN